MPVLIYYLLGAALVAYFVAMVLLWRFQERVVFQPPRPVPDPAGAVKVAYTASDGVALHAFVVGDCAKSSFVILAFHGNADLAAWLVPWASRAARETGACVILPEYRGYGGLRGPPTYDGVTLDAQAALGFVREQLGVPPSRTVYFGHSLGSAVAAELAEAAEPRALVLQSPFSSARAMANRMLMPGLGGLWALVSRVHYDTIRRVRAIRAPVSVAHGDRDLVIPVRMGQEVFDAAPQRGELLVVPGAGHNDVDEIGQALYWDWLRRACQARPVAMTL